jgi:fatty-acyl-CoA synthase
MAGGRIALPLGPELGIYSSRPKGEYGHSNAMLFVDWDYILYALTFPVFFAKFEAVTSGGRCSFPITVTGEFTRHRIRRTHMIEQLVGPVKRVGQVPQITLPHYDGLPPELKLLHGVVSYWAKAQPKKPAVITVAFDEEQQMVVEETTYEILDLLTTALAFRLYQLGLRPGDVFAAWLPFIKGHILLQYACSKIGVVHLPLDLRWKPDAVIQMLKQVGANGFGFLGNTPKGDFRPVAEAVKQQCPSVKFLLQFSPPDQSLAPGAYSAMTVAFEAMSAYGGATVLERQEFERVMSDITPGHSAQIICTSGSTGQPKAAVLSHRNITVQNLCLGMAFDISPESRMLVNLPPWHVGGQAEQFMTTLFFGGTAVVLRLFDSQHPEESLEVIQRFGCTILGMIPTMLRMLWRLPNYSEFDLSSLTAAIYGGEQLFAGEPEKLAAMAGKWGTGLGLTETAGFCTYGLDGLIGNLGYGMPITPLSIRAPMGLDGNAGRIRLTGQVGEVCISGPQVFGAYLGDPIAYRQAVSPGGICYTGDLGFVDEQGRLHLTGRSKLVAKVGGNLFSLESVERHFMECGGVNACVAVALSHHRTNEGVILVYAGEADEAKLAAHAAGIAAYQRPARYVKVDSLPALGSGKADRQAIRAIARQAAGQYLEDGWKLD